MIFRQAAINFLAVLVFSVDTSFSFTFVPSTSTSSYLAINNKNKLFITPHPNTKFSTGSISRRFMSESSPSVSTEDDSDVKKDDEEIVFAEDPTKGKEPELNVNDIVLLKEICMKSGVMDKSSSEEVDENVVEQILFQALPSMSSQLLMALRKQSFDTTNNKALLDGEKEINQEEIQSMVQKMGPYLETIVDTKLEQGRELLKSFLDAGELRRLDTLISKAAQKNELNMAFFSVLNLNIKDAYEESVAIEAQKKAAEDAEEEENNSEASRFSILQHIYTRCQEEVEKTVDPGVALLNKLLRTSVKSIRTNQIEHYLTPQKTSITSPDGKTIELPSTSPNKTLVSHEDFVSALEKAVQQIRMVENSGGTDRQTAANLTESCRQVAIETRMTIAQVYGIKSDELKEFEKSLQPVFRPQG